MDRRRLTDRFVEAVKPPATGRAMHYDALVPGLALLVTPTGAKSYVLYRVWPGTGKPARRSLGGTKTLTLAEARDKARGWLAQLERGVDPAAEAKRQAEEAKQQRDDTFSAVAEVYLARHVHGQRRARMVEREIRKELISRWGDKPVTAVTKRDVVAMVDDIVDRGARRQAHNILGHARGFFNWAINRGVYGLESSPCDRLRPTQLIGAKNIRQEVLSDDELVAVWRASSRLPYPFGPLYQVLLLTGQRLNEVARARWSEFDLVKARWVIPPERFKSNAAQTVPLTGTVLAILTTLPRFVGGDFVFTTTHGRKPVSDFSFAKARLDARMGRTLRALAKRRGDAPGEPKRWQNHDLRRTLRTRLSELRVPEVVSERVIGHGAKGLARVYDQHRYLAEMREALEHWEAHLRGLVAPPIGDNVVPLRREAG